MWQTLIARLRLSLVESMRPLDGRGSGAITCPAEADMAAVAHASDRTDLARTRLEQAPPEDGWRLHLKALGAALGEAAGR